MSVSLSCAAGYSASAVAWNDPDTRKHVCRYKPNYLYLFWLMYLVQVNVDIEAKISPNLYSTENSVI